MSHPALDLTGETVTSLDQFAMLLDQAELEALWRIEKVCLTKEQLRCLHDEIARSMTHNTNAQTLRPITIYGREIVIDEEDKHASEREKHTTTIGKPAGLLQVEWNYRSGYTIIGEQLIPDTHKVISIAYPKTRTGDWVRLIDLSPEEAENLRLWLESQKERIHDLLQEESNK